MPRRPRARRGPERQGGERVVFHVGSSATAALGVRRRRRYDELAGRGAGRGREPAGEAPPDPLAALARFGAMAAAEVEAVCDLPGPSAAGRAVARSPPSGG